MSFFGGGGGGGLTKVTDAGKYPTLQAAADAAGVGGHLYIPAGTYTSGLALTLDHDGITIEGCGEGSYIHVSSGHAISISGNGSHIKHVTVKNLKIKSDGTDQTGVGVYVHLAEYVALEGLFFPGSASCSVRMFGAWSCSVRHCRFEGHTGVGDEADILMQWVNGNVISDNILIGSTNQGTGGYGIQVCTGPDAWDSLNCIIADNYIDNYSVGIYLKNGGFHSVTGNFLGTGNWIGLQLDCYRVDVTGNHLRGTKAIYLQGQWFSITGNYIEGIIDGVGWNGTVTLAGNSFSPGLVHTMPGSDIGSFEAGNLRPVSTNFQLSSTGGDNYLTAASGTPFATARPGDVLHVHADAQGSGFYKVLQVIDSTHIRVDRQVPKLVTVYCTLSRLALGLTSEGDIVMPGTVNGAVKKSEFILTGAVTNGSVAAINTTPTAGGAGYAVNDLIYIQNESAQSLTGGLTMIRPDCAVFKVTGATDGVVTSLVLVDSGRKGYVVGTGIATERITGSGNGNLTVEITAVGLSAEQVSGSILVNTGQGNADVANYLPTARAGYNFKALMGMAKTNYSWALANNSGIRNGASGDLMSLNGTDGTAGSAHGIKVGSGATNISKGDWIEFSTVCIDAASDLYQWIAKVIQGTTWTAY